MQGFPNIFSLRVLFYKVNVSQRNANVKKRKKQVFFGGGGGGHGDNE